METIRKEYIYTTKRTYLPFILPPVMLITGMIFGKHYILAILIVPVWLLLLRYVKYADFKDSVIEVCYPLRRNNIFIQYSAVTSVQFHPKPLKGDAAIKIHTKDHGDYSFAIYPEQGNPIIHRLKKKNPMVTILKPGKLEE